MSLEATRDRYFNDVFTSEWCDNFTTEFALNIPAEGRQDVRDTLSWIAAQYEPLKKGNTGKSSYEEDRNILVNASKSLEESKEILLKAFNRFECQMRFHAANKQSAQLLIKREFLGNGYSEGTDLVSIIRFISTLSQTCEQASRKEFDPPYKNTSIALEVSMLSLIPCWKKYFPSIQYTEGAHYGKNTKHNTPAIYLLEEIFSKIDGELVRSQFGTALKNTKKSYK